MNATGPARLPVNYLSDNGFTPSIRSVGSAHDSGCVISRVIKIRWDEDAELDVTMEIRNLRFPTREAWESLSLGWHPGLSGWNGKAAMVLGRVAS